MKKMKELKKIKEYGINHLLILFKSFTDRKIIFQKCLKIFFIFQPLVLFLIQYSVLGGVSISKVYPVYNDEVAWFMQIDSMVHEGMPLGYWGYNGTHSAWGTAGPWGVAVLLPYVAFGKIFGWDLSSMCYANIFFMCTANYIFLKLVKSYKSIVKYLILISFFLYINILYLGISMSECLRYSIAIILCGMFYKLYNSTSSKVYRYLIMPTTILMVSQIYMLFAAFLPIYIWNILSKKSIIHKIGYSVLCTSGLAFLSYYLTSKLSSPYIESTIGEILNALENEGVFIALGKCLKIIIANLNGINPLTNTDAGRMFVWFMIIYYIMLIICIYNIFIKQNIKKYIWISSLYMMLIFLGAFVCLYSTQSGWTLIRGINIALLFFVYNISTSKNLKCKYLILGLFFSGILCFQGYFFGDFLEQRKYNQTWEREYIVREQKYRDNLVISSVKSKWDNTVALYGDLDATILGMPSGVGINAITDDKIITCAGYSAVQKEKSNYKTIVASLKSKGYHLLFEDEKIILLENKA